MRTEESLFAEAVSLPAADRAAFLEWACAGQPELRSRVEALLRADDASGFMEDRTAVLDGACVSEQSGERIGRYRLLQHIGEGGFGTVWMAEQAEPVTRRVALKIIKAGMDTKEVIARFEAERQALAMMDHPNIAKVFDAGATDRGRPFFVMELVKGVTITQFCDEQQLTTRKRLELFADVCSAVNHAHQKGVIHRDIKPSNVMVTLNGERPLVKVIDFGIAKATQGKLTDQTLFTRFEQFVGTPAYMSPEQTGLSMLDVDTRSDIYALGILLYELLTGKPPFDAKTLLSAGYEEMCRVIREEDPPKPSSRLSTIIGEERTALARGRHVDPDRLHRCVEADLDWIVMKAIEKDRTRRYETANGLALDIQRFLSDEPVSAGSPGTVYRFQKAIRRHRRLYAFGAALAGSLLSGLALAMLGWRDAEMERDAAVAARAGEEAQRQEAEMAERATRRRAYAAEMSGGFEALAANNLGRARELLDRQRPLTGEEDLRGFEWRYLWKLCRSDELASFADGGTTGLSFSPDGGLIAYGGNKVIVRELAEKTVIATLEQDAWSTAFSPQGSLLATGDESQVYLWNTTSWTRERRLSGACAPVVFSPDGAWLVTGSEGGHLIWNTETWRTSGFCPGEPESLPRSVMRHAVAFSEDGRKLLTPGHRNGININEFQLWEFPVLTPIDTFRHTPVPGLWSVAFGPNPDHFLTGHFSGELCVWDRSGGKPIEILLHHQTGISAITHSRGGSFFATASADHSLLLWDAQRYRPLARLRGHLGEVRSLALSPDGKLLASGGLDGTTKLWTTAFQKRTPYLRGSRSIVGIAADSQSLLALPDDRTGLSAGRRSTITRWNYHSGATVETHHGELAGLKWQSRYAKAAALHPGGILFSLGRPDGIVEVWNSVDSVRIASWKIADAELLTSAFSPDGRYLAVGTTDGSVSVWDHASRREMRRFSDAGNGGRHLSFSPDGSWLACGGETGVRLWDLRKEHPPLVLDIGPGEVTWLAFAPDSLLLATCSDSNNDVVLSELPSGRFRTRLRGHSQMVDGLAFSPDGKTLATGSHDRQVKFWCTTSGFEIATIRTEGACKSLAFSPDGNSLAVGYYRTTNDYGIGGGALIEMWQAPSWEEIAGEERNASAGINATSTGGSVPKKR